MPRIEAQQPTPQAETFPVSFVVITHEADAPMMQGLLNTLPANAEVCILTNRQTKDGEEPTLSEVEVKQVGTLTLRLQHWVYAGSFHFAEARNLCDQLATNEWRMWIDTDDRLAHCQHELLRRFATTCPAGYGAAWCGVASYEPSWDGMAQGKITSAYQIRLYRGSIGARWEGRVHEQIYPHIQQLGFNASETSIIVIHTGYMGSVEQREAKLRRNFDLLTKQVVEGATTQHLTNFFESALQDTASALRELDIIKRNKRNG